MKNKLKRRFFPLRLVGIIFHRFQQKYLLKIQIPIQIISLIFLHISLQVATRILLYTRQFGYVRILKYLVLAKWRLTLNYIARYQTKILVYHIATSTKPF